jgi:hypothetical protein
MTNITELYKTRYTSLVIQGMAVFILLYGYETWTWLIKTDTAVIYKLQKYNCHDQ